MADRFGNVWSMVNAVGSLDAMRRGREQLGIQQAGEKRAQTKFEQGQKNVAFDNSVKRLEGEYIEALRSSGLVDERGNPTNQWNSTASQNLAESTRESAAMKKKEVEKDLEKQGPDALARFTAQSNVNNRLAQNAQADKVLTQTALDKGVKDAGDIKTVTTEARHAFRSGNTKKALKLLKEAIDNSVARRKGDIVGDKLYIIETVAGVKHRGPGLTYPEVEEFLNNYSMEEHAITFAADAQAGRELALKPPIRMRTPDGQIVLVKQVGTSYSVDYFFFKPDGNKLKNAPENLEEAYSKGWEREESVLERERGIAKEERATAESAAKVGLAKAKTEGLQTKESVDRLTHTEKKRYDTTIKELAGLRTSLADPFGDPEMKRARIGELTDLMKRLETKEARGSAAASRQDTLRQLAKELKTKYPNTSPEQKKELLKLKSGAYGEGEEAQRMWEDIMNELAPQRPSLGAGGGW